MTTHQVVLSPTRIVRLLVIVSILLLMCHYIGYFHREFVGSGFITHSFAPKFDLDGEQTVPAFFSSLLLLLASLILFAIASEEGKTKYRMHWWILGGIFAFMSLDEAVGFHELLTMPVRSRVDLPGWLHFAWVIPAAAFVLGFVIGYARFVLSLPRRYQLLFVISGILYVGGAIGMEIISASFRGTNIYNIVMPMEEILEMIGVIIFVYSIISYKGEYGNDLTIRIN